MNMIISRIRNDSIVTSQDPISYRTAYEWLMIEKSYKGQKWFVNKFLDRGQVFVIGEDENYWVIESQIEITLNESEFNNRFYCSGDIPKYVVMLRHKENANVPVEVKELYKEVYESAAVGV